MENQVVRCSVTHHLVEETSKQNKDLFLDARGNIKLTEVLFHLGFKINKKVLTKNVSVHNNMLIRSSKNKRQCYRTKVYKGVLRNAIKDVVGEEIIYHKHKLHDLYDKYVDIEVLQPDNLYDYVKEKDLHWIDEFGGRSSLLDCLEEDS